MAVILIGGGSRSGKSTYALERARQQGGRFGFLATAQAVDDEMRERIARHQADRGSDFALLEEPVHVAEAIRRTEKDFDVLVVDCLTFWLSNLLVQEAADLEGRSRDVVNAAAQAKNDVILVTNEVGCGVVPETVLGRQFRDAAGRLNQIAAAAANEVYWMVFGIPMRIK